MDQFNKVISFFLGLIVVVVFLAVATGKINLKGKKASTTPTPTPAATSTVTYKEISAPDTPAPATRQDSQYRRYDGIVTTGGAIPNTGPEFLLSLIISSYLGGSFLKKMSEKR
jgi:hypothetical protein